MRLIGVLGFSGEPGETQTSGKTTRKMQEALKAENGLKQFGSVTNRSAKATVKLPRADADILANLVDAPARTLGQQAYC